MAQTQLDLFNLALSIAGSDFTIASVEEQSLAAEACRLWYDNVREVVLRSAHWNSAKRYSRLDEEAERSGSAEWKVDDPEPGYALAYLAPRDMLAARYITTFGEFALGTIFNLRIISTNTKDPILCYTIDVEDPKSWEPDLYQSVAYALAAHITMPLTGKPNRVRTNLGLAFEFVQMARANSANEMHQRLEARTQILGARGYNFTPVTPFIYPYGAFFAGTGAPTT